MKISGIECPPPLPAACHNYTLMLGGFTFLQHDIIICEVSWPSAVSSIPPPLSTAVPEVELSLDDHLALVLLKFDFTHPLTSQHRLDWSVPQMECIMFVSRIFVLIFLNLALHQGLFAL